MPQLFYPPLCAEKLVTGETVGTSEMTLGDLENIFHLIIRLLSIWFYQIAESVEDIYRYSQSLSSHSNESNKK